MGVDQGAADAREEARTRLLASGKLAAAARPAWQWVAFWGGACAVCGALELGYRMIDTAANYGESEAGNGEGSSAGGGDGDGDDSIFDDEGEDDA